jgi:hypothetical protein
MFARIMPLLLIAAAGGARAMDGVDANLLMPQLTWEKRVLLVFAPNTGDARLEQQNAVLAAVEAGLIERDMTVIRALASDFVSVDGVGGAQPAESFYRRFGVDAGEFRVILVGKDGTVKLDSKAVVSDDELFQLIDAMPMRRYERSQDG